jgi:cyclopropane fatty-acyl-phospholipid synthase-like methyltransferase
LDVVGLLRQFFLHREFGVQVWATDLWFDASENMQRIRDAGAEAEVFPIHANARSLPFAEGFFDAIISIDSFFYYGTDDHYLNYLSRYAKPDGRLAIAGAGLMQEVTGAIPDHLQEWWTPDVWCLHSADWWRRHWSRSGIVEVGLADSMPDGFQRWIDWQAIVAPDNQTEIQAMEADAGRYMGYVRMVARRRGETPVDDPVESISIPAEYVPAPLLRGNVE